MVSTVFDPVQYKIEQRRSWDEVAPGWRKWWTTVERGTQAISDHMVLLARTQTGDTVLDVATGYGEPALTAAQRVGTSGRVIGIDLAPQLLAIARDRATASGMRHTNFYEMDAEELNLPNDSFDAILCRFGMTYFPNPMVALATMKNHLKIGGRLVTAVWATPSGELEALATRSTAALERRGIPGHWDMTDKDSMVQKFIEAGFNEVFHETIRVTFEFASIDDFILYNQEAIAPLRAIISRVSSEQQEKLWAEIRERSAKQFSTDDGKLRMPAEAVCIVGRR